MMRQKADFKMTHIEDPPLEVLEMPYYGKDLSMIIFLPKALEGLPELETQLTAKRLGSWLDTLNETTPNETWVFLPRFTTSQSFDLKPMLKSLGMRSAFERAADFSGMDGTKNLFISDVLHQAVVEVNEAGTEVAAATMIAVKTMSQSYHFNANHPFLFLIRDNGSGSILFLGRIVDPTK